MANQIARNFAVMGDVDAAAATADHILTFWDPRMKAAIVAGPDGLSAVAGAAVDQIRRHVAVPHQTPATVFATASGAGGSDAG